MELLFLLFIFSYSFAYEKDLTFTVHPGRTDCFYHKVLPNEVIDVDYQVIDADHGELDISFQMADPVGRVIVAEYKKSESTHQHTATLNGDYRFCFDNTFSTISVKTVFFDLMIDTENTEDRNYSDEDKEMEFHDTVETYIMKIRDILEAVGRVKDNISAARRLQELRSAHEARDRNRAEEMCERVLRFSLCLLCLTILVGIGQVMFVRLLFSERSFKIYSRFLPGFASRS